MALSTLHKSTQVRTFFVPEFPKDLQQYILLQLDDNDLAKTFRTSKEAANFCDNDEFWRLRILFVYNSDLSKYKEKGKNYKEIYIKLRKYEKKSIEKLLIRAAYLGYLPVITYLVKREADIQTGSQYLEVVLRTAASKGHLPVVIYLVENGATASSHTNDVVALKYAAFNGHLPVVTYLVEKIAAENGHVGNEGPDEALISAASNGKLLVVKYLVERGASKDTKEDAINRAACLGRLPVIKYLVEKGVNIHPTNIYKCLGWENA